MQKAPLNDKKTTHDHPKCEGIMPEHCDEIGQTTFTNDPADIFKEIKLLEDRYNYTISKMKEKMDKKVQDAQKEYGENYRTSLEGKKKQILQDVSELKKEIEKNIELLNQKEKQILEKIDQIYSDNAKNLIKQAIKILDFDFDQDGVVS